MATVQSATQKTTDVFASLGLGQKSSAATNGSMEGVEDRFLTLLVTQIRNQDPLNPMDNAQMTSQIAQINTVNGIEKLNAAINKLVGYFEGGQAMEAAGMIGKHVLVTGNDLALTNAGGIAGYSLAAPADSLKVTIKDGNGLVMRTLDLGQIDEAGTGNFFWDGKTDAGVAAAPGTYSFELAAKRGTEDVKAEALAVGTVNAVTRTGNGFELDLGERGGFRFDDVRQIL
jgi:flagellar basal-body rod modification protein FlgD